MNLSNKKILIAYYSRKGNNWFGNGIVDLKVGNTEVAATLIQELTKGDLFHIEAVHAYPLGYDECTEVAKTEFKTKARPVLTKTLTNFKDYDVIFLGYPNWWGTMPMPAFTFLDSYDFTGKIVLPFCTHEGSAMGNSERDIAKSLPTAKILKGLAIRGSSASSAKSALEKWIESSEEVK